jgi:hypothetical protein
MTVVPCLILQSLPTDAGVRDVTKSLQGSSTLSFLVTILKANENTAIQNFLQTVYAGNPQSYAMIIRDTSITTADSASVAKYVEQLIESNNAGTYPFDTCLMGMFLDSCNQYTDTRSILSLSSNGPTDVTTETSTYLSRTMGAKGTEAVLFSPSGMTKYFNDVTKYPSFNETMYYAAYGLDGKSGVMRTTSFVPSLYNFNPVWANSISDYVKTSSCSNTKPAATQSSTTGTALQFLIFVVVIVLLVLLVWLLFNITPQPNYSSALMV